MAKRPAPENEYVKKSTVITVCFIALAVGFLGGIVLSAYKSGSSVPASKPVPAPQQQPFRPQPFSVDQSKVIEALEQATSKNPDDSNAWTKLGNAYFDNNQFEKAIGAYEKSLSLNPNDANVQTDLGVMYRRSGQPEKAIAAFDRAMQIDPRHEISRFNKGIVLMHDLNDREAAIAAWEDLARLNPLAKTPNGTLVKDMIKNLK